MEGGKKARTNPRVLSSTIGLVDFASASRYLLDQARPAWFRMISLASGWIIASIPAPVQLIRMSESRLES